MTNKLNLGCGKKILRGFVNVDIQKGPGIDKSFDFNKFPYPIPDDSYDYILLDNVLEHLDDPKRVLHELHRISRKGARIRIIVPYYHCKGAYNDVTHKHFFNETTFDNLVNPENYYYHESGNKFNIIKIDLVPTRIGKIIYPKTLRNAMSYILGEIISTIDVEFETIK